MAKKVKKSGNNNKEVLMPVNETKTALKMILIWKHIVTWNWAYSRRLKFSIRK